MKHKHCDVIKAWADGAIIEVETELVGWQVERTPCFYVNRNYRVKPETKKYRVALYAGIAHVTEDPLNNWETLPHFIKWLTDWMEYEI